jgi:hypothetical protein
VQLKAGFLTGAAALVFLVLGASGRVEAAVVPTNACGDDCEALIETLLGEDEQTILPQLYEPAERFDAADGAAPCAAATPEPTVYAIVLAPFYDWFPLDGTQNDAKLLKSLFLARGLAETNIHILDGNQVTREKMIAAMRPVAQCVRERDQVIVTFSGMATSFRKWRAGSLADFRDVLGCDGDEELGEDADALCSQPVDDDLETLFTRMLENHNEHMLVDSSSYIENPTFAELNDNDRISGLRSSDLSNFATQVRNRGGDVVFVLDTNYAEDFQLLYNQQLAAFDTAWNWTRGYDLAPNQKSEDVVELFGSGGMAALYAARADELAYEAKQTGGVALGELTFAISEALHTLQSPTILELAGEIDRTMAEKEVDQVPVFEATNPEMRFLATRIQPQANPDDVEILAPSVTPGGLTPQVKATKISARYRGTERAAFAAIDGVNIEIGDDGQFAREVTLGERTEVPLRVYGRDASLLSERRLLFGDDATEALLPAVGRRVALIIANDTYTDPAYPKLATPIADGEAVAKALTETFGYSLTLDLGNGKERGLFLRNATKSDIQKALFDLRKRLTATDQLVVYYAGHGEIDDEETAYWVPVDGEAGMDVTWLRAFDITDEMRRINAGAMLLVSDSCYAGGLSRSVRSLKEEDAPRDTYLAQAARFKARQLISSGGVQPVEDGGGGGHSLFARALLDALAEMPEKVFTASELFEQKLKPGALALAAAQKSTQIPGYFRMASAGDEPSSEFIFRRK